MYVIGRLITKRHLMENIYSKKSCDHDKNLQPSKETVNRILNYSKALSVMNTKFGKFENLLN